MPYIKAANVILVSVILAILLSVWSFCKFAANVLALGEVREWLALIPLSTLLQK
jgi:hypothetical protein